LPQAREAILTGRAALKISGADAASFLQGLITNDIDKASKKRAVFAALLSPQGKVLFDFFAVEAESGYLLDCAASAAGDLLKRLSFYKLRARVAIEDVSADWRIGTGWGAEPAFAGVEGAYVFPDPRLAALGWRAFIPAVAAQSADLAGAMGASEAYEAHRIALAAPEGGKDYSFGDIFPHDACFDLLNGVDFKKGCFVGQEVVSRMQHRGTARTRVLIVEAASPLTAGVPIDADGFPIGKIGSAAGRRGIALVRLDRAASALAEGQNLAAAGQAISLSVPDWANYQLRRRQEEAKA
jgi:folate-binding protein YgfZ